MNRTPIKRHTPMSRGTSTLKRSGFGPRTLVKPSARSGKTIKPWKSAKPKTWRSEEYLAAVRKLDCTCCGREKRFTQAAHSNQPRFGKGGRIKASDATAMPLCSFPAIGVSGCHELHDQGGKRTKAEWWAFEYRHISLTILLLIRLRVLMGSPDILLSTEADFSDDESRAVYLVALIESGKLQVAK